MEKVHIFTVHVLFTFNCLHTFFLFIILHSILIALLQDLSQNLIVYFATLSRTFVVATTIFHHTYIILR